MRFFQHVFFFKLFFFLSSTKIPVKPKYIKMAFLMLLLKEFMLCLVMFGTAQHPINTLPTLLILYGRFSAVFLEGFPHHMEHRWRKIPSHCWGEAVPINLLLHLDIYILKVCTHRKWVTRRPSLSHWKLVSRAVHIYIMRFVCCPNIPGSGFLGNPLVYFTPKMFLSKTTYIWTTHIVIHCNKHCVHWNTLTFRVTHCNTL